MNLDIRLNGTGLPFISGFPSAFSDYLLPQAKAIHVDGSMGTICIQEVRTEKYVLRHFLFFLKQTLSFSSHETGEGLQSLMSLKGDIEFQVQGMKPIHLNEKEYVLFNAHERQMIASVRGGVLCSILNSYFAPGAYANLLSLFPRFQKDLKKAAGRPFHFSFSPKVARYTVHDAIRAIWFDKYVQTLQKKHIEMRLENTLFTLLAQTYTAAPIEAVTLQEREKAAAAREIILRDIAKHLTLEEIAAELYCSPAWIKRTFSKVYGIGMFNFLRRTRMELAREMLIKGASLKAVAIEVGMKPRNFPKEFKSFYGYTVTELKKGLF